MVLYCIVTQTFIFDLFTAAILPAVIAIALNLTAIAVVVRMKPVCSHQSPRWLECPWPGSEKGGSGLAAYRRRVRRAL